VCEHLRTRETSWLSYYRWYSGKAMGFDLLCDSCRADRRAGAKVELGSVCTACLDRIQDEIGDLVGVEGVPAILERPIGITSDLRHTSIPEQFGDLLDFAPLEKSSGSVWLGLTSTGKLIQIDSSAGAVSQLTEVTVPLEDDHKPWCGHELRHRLHVSSDGTYIAIVDDYGRQGLVLETSSGRVTMELDGGKYHPETVPFSVSFVDFGGRPLLVHRTAWNRLDVSDPAHGLLLTQRTPTSFERGETRPEHYLDYFHEALYVSPDGGHLLDDGWIWHPMGHKRCVRYNAG
jgi:hypothetical protein